MLGFFAIYVIWGSTYLAIRFAIETLPPFLMAAVRWIIPGACLVAWARLRDHAPAPNATHLRSTAIIGILLLLGGNGLVSWAEQWVPSGTAALLVASIPLWMAVLAWGIARAKGHSHSLPRVTVFGLLLGFAGVATLVGGAVPGKDGAATELQVLVGSIGLLGAAFLWAIGSLYARGASLPASPLLATGLEMLWGGGALLAIGTLTGEWARVDLAQVSMRSILSLVYLIVFGSVLGFSAYVWLLRVSTPSKVSTYAYVNPVVAVLLGWLFAGEPITPRILLAATIVIAAVVMITTSRSRTAAPTPTSGSPSASVTPAGSASL